MNAIAGFWAFGVNDRASRQCAAMLAAQSDYGPAANKLGQLGSLALGRNRFRLLPEDEFDQQPMLFGNGRFALVADIRLDNRGHLSALLGIPPASAHQLSDSSLLAHAFARWGEQCLHRLVGDYAFALYDADDRRLILARDPLGQRPLFWHQGEDFVAFASMPKGIHALGTLPRRSDRTSMARFIGLLPQAGTRSYFEGIQRVQPGHVATISPSSSSSRRYWNPERRELRLANFGDYVEAFREQLDQAVQCRLRGTGKSIAAHLSAGWDSSSVAATAARLVEPGGRSIIAFTSTPRSNVEAPAPNHRFSDEGPIAAATAAMYPNIKHILMPSSSASPIAKLDLYVKHFDRPLHNLCNHVWLSEIRDAAREHGARIMLTGEIGNFTISSAPANLLADFLRQKRFLAWAREAIAAAASHRARVRGVIASSFGPWVPDFIWNRVRRLSSAPELNLATAVHPHLREAIAQEQEAQHMGLAWRPKNNFRSTVDGLFAMDWGEYRKGVLGGWGLDKRDATADSRLIEFCLSLPLDMLLKNGIRRPLARAALSDRLPAAVLEERRKGYQAADWSIGLSRDLQSVNALLDKIAQHPSAERMIDVDLLRTLVRDWPQRGWEEPKTMVRYRTALLHALSAGHFITSTPD